MNLYHYTKLETGIRKILPRMKLRMNFLSKMNDPNENLYHIVNLEEGIFNRKSYGLSSDEYLMAQKITNETRILAFTVDKEVISDNIKSNILGYQFQRMWTYYGQNHEGICLDIDYDKFIIENKKLIDNYQIIDKKVKYGNYFYRGIPVPIYGMSPENQKKHKAKCLCEFWADHQKNEQFVDQRFFSKNIDWEGESEYRFLTFNKDLDDILLSIKQSLNRIIIGINFSKYLLPSLIELIPKEFIYGIDTDFEGNFEIRQIDI